MTQVEYEQRLERGGRLSKRLFRVYRQQMREFEKGERSYAPPMPTGDLTVSWMLLHDLVVQCLTEEVQDGRSETPNRGAGVHVRACGDA